MPVVSCPSCSAKVQIEDRDLGYDVECPYCQKIFPARTTRSASPPPPPPPARRPAPDPEDTESYGFSDKPAKSKMPRRTDGSRYDDDDEYDDRPRRRSKSRRPRYDDDDDYSDDELIADAKKAVFTPALLERHSSAVGILLALGDIVAIIAFPQMMKQQNNPILAQMSDETFIAIRIAAICWESLLFSGACCMMRLRAYGFCKAVMVMRILPFAGLCCIIGFAFGIWGLNALNKDEVKEAFELVKNEGS